VRSWVGVGRVFRISLLDFIRAKRDARMPLLNTAEAERHDSAPPLLSRRNHIPRDPLQLGQPEGARRAVPLSVYFKYATLDNPALAQIVYFCSHAVEPTVAIDDQEPFRRQETEDWIAEAIIVGGDLVRVETKLRSERS
jgi:hypothetical protein